MTDTIKGYLCPKCGNRMLSEGWLQCPRCGVNLSAVTPPKPAHIDTTAPQVIRAEDQVRPPRRCPDGCIFNEDSDSECLNCANTDRRYARECPGALDCLGCSKCAPTPSPIDTTGQEKRYQVKDLHTHELLASFPTREQADTSARALKDYQQRDTFVDVQTAVAAPASIATTQGDEEMRPEFEVRYEVTAVIDHADFIQQVADDLADVQYVCVVKAQPNELAAPQAEAQAPQADRDEAWRIYRTLSKGSFDNHARMHFTSGYLAAWNAQQAKIESLEQRVKYWQGRSESAWKLVDESGMEKISMAAKISELEEKLREGK